MAGVSALPGKIMQINTCPEYFVQIYVGKRGQSNGEMQLVTVIGLALSAKDGSFARPTLALKGRKKEQ